MLEQIAYQLSRVNKTNQRVYQVGDLESLSASTLYSDYGDTDFNHRMIETVFPGIDGKGCLKIYIDPFSFSGTAGYHNKGEKHKDYAKRMEESGGISLGGGISALPSSTTGGY